MFEWEDMTLTEKILIVILIVFFSAFVLVGICIVIDGLTEENIRNETVECYDRKGNEIVGVECIDEIYCGIIAKRTARKYCYGGRE